ncbi:hypothetical protein F5883DRAFT_261310 [Diaporthe sp. PMI_573]|nr:hypothetical protein F5883DRAFT_261310 [Diaporthaceae sp. PMI_573]
MATQSLLLSCFLMGLGVAQHPVSEGIQTQNVPSSTVGSSASGAVGSATSTEPPYLQDDNQCDLYEIVKIEDSAKIFCFCGLVFPDWLGPNLPANCAAVPGLEDFADYLEEQCPDDPKVVPYLYASVQHEVLACAHCPQVQECQNISQVLNRHGVPFWDDSTANNESCPFFPDDPTDDQGKGLHFRRDATASIFRSTSGDSLERSDADEPYHPILKSVYEDCDALEDPELRLDCVIKEIQRALCEQEPWIPACEDLESDRTDGLPSKPAASDNELSDEIFDTDGGVQVADDDDSLSQRQVTAAPEPTETASLDDWDVASRMHEFIIHPGVPAFYRLQLGTKRFDKDR